MLKRLLIAVLIIVIISIVATIGIGNYFVNYAILRTGNGGDREVKNADSITVANIDNEAEKIIEENKKNFVDNNVPNFDSIDGAIYMEVTNAIESLLDTVTSDKDWESAVLARTNLLNEAAKYMTEEMGRVPTKEELSEYTKIPVDEIRGIMGLSKDTQRIADTTPGHKSI